MKVEKLMTRQVRTCRADESLADAAQRMWEGDCGVLPVVDEGGAVVGMLTDRDVCMAGYTQGLPLNALRIASAMSRRVLSCQLDDELSAAEETMQVHQVRRLPVVGGDGRLAGILSLADLALAGARGGRARGVRPEEVAETLGAVCHPWAAPREESVVPVAPAKVGAGAR